MGFGDRLRAVLRPLPGEERGFTIIEILVASFILVLGSLAIFMTFAAAIHNVQRSRESQVGISVAQRELERVRVIQGQDFDAIRLTAPPPLPTAGTEESSPFSRVRSSGGVLQFAIDRGDPGSAYWDLVVPANAPPGAPAGEVEYESPEPVHSKDGTEVIVYRFVVCEPDPPGCDSRRVIVDVQPVARANQGSYQHAYTELQTTVVNPEAELEP